MQARYILAVLGAAFFVAGGVGMLRTGNGPGNRYRTWLMVGAIFLVVSVYLFTAS